MMRLTGRVDPEHMPVAAAPAQKVCLPPRRLLDFLCRISGCGRTGEQRRENRMLYLLIAVWIINLFDLGLTLIARQQRLLTELNPLAVHVFAWGPVAVAVYKMALLAAGTAILWWQRRRPMAELALCGYAVICLGLAVHWYRLYHTAEPLWVEAGTIKEILPPEVYYSAYTISQAHGASPGRAVAQGANGAPADGGFDDRKESRADEQNCDQPAPPLRRPEGNGGSDPGGGQ